MEPRYVEFVPEDVEELAAFLSDESWPFHSGSPVDRATVRDRVARGVYANPATRTFWIELPGEGRIGLVRLNDLDGSNPMFDLRLRATYRGRGHGVHAVRWLTGFLFNEMPGIRRIEANTRQDNRAMRRVLRHCGYAKEAHYRQAWPSESGHCYDSIGYAVLRSDWESSTVTPPDWNDEEE